MRKKIATILTSLVVALSCITPFFFTSTKAETLTPGTVGSYGSYYAETFGSINNQNVMSSYVIDLGFIQFNMNVANCSCFHYHYDFKNYYSGQIHLTVTSNLSYTLTNCTFSVTNGQFSNIPNKTTSSSSKTFVITFENVPYIDFYLYHNGTSVNNYVFLTSTAFTVTFDYMTPHDSEIGLLEHIDDVQMMIYDYMTDDMETTLQSMLSALTAVDNSVHNGEFMVNVGLENPITYSFNELNGGYIYSELLTAYTLKRLDFRFNYNNLYDGNYMVITYYIQSSTRYTDSDFDGFVLSTRDHANQLNNITSKVKYETYCNYKTSANTGVYLITFYVPINLLTNSTQTTEWQLVLSSINFANVTRVGAIYRGVVQNLPEHLTDSVSLLDKILTAIRNLGGENLYDTSTYDDAVDDIGDFMDNVITTVPSINDVQNDVTALPSFDPTDPSYKLDDLAGFTNYVYVQMSNIIPFLKTFVLLGLFIIVLKVFVL